MLVVAAAMMAPVSWYAWSLRQSAERSTADEAKVGSAHVFAQARQPAIVHSRSWLTLESVGGFERPSCESTRNTGAESTNSRRSRTYGIGRFVASSSVAPLVAISMPRLVWRIETGAVP